MSSKLVKVGLDRKSNKMKLPCPPVGLIEHPFRRQPSRHYRVPRVSHPRGSPLALRCFTKDHATCLCFGLGSTSTVRVATWRLLLRRPNHRCQCGAWVPALPAVPPWCGANIVEGLVRRHAPVRPTRLNERAATVMVVGPECDDGMRLVKLN